ncbi:AzlD domain-containing protein [Ureibacillus sp. FSL K6-8385]|uniref:AzlD domain-containing protein n=1 Tax=Ureibacillus terrenus TaxID=118246 RepID=A0A540V2T7_9BACL|nr:AzlD domain-containing protein [Ureibacillus terrenus]MED3662104.1 AzlD domain-containing protein [Ureibacillus terrenus]MED3763578.1 AzlD domain-containing protein [Ureibacillus terrenus]TQE91064.1 AzlD domain-containing protein [Ureibacillus terrenus]
MNQTICYILIMALVTYFIRVLPLTLVRKEIKNIYIRSFLHYVPYVTLAVMIFPGILDSTSSPWSALVGFIVAIIAAYSGRSVVTVALLTCGAVFITEWFLY